MIEFGDLDSIENTIPNFKHVMDQGQTLKAYKRNNGGDKWRMDKILI